jgi:hypothetical protein
MRAFTWFPWSALLLIIVILSGLEAFLDPVLHFAFGWIFSSARLVNAFEGSLAPLWWTAACIGLVIGTHFFLNSWRNGALRWRTTVVVMGTLFMVLLSGMAITGTTHQVAWLATSSEPWIHSFRGYRSRAFLHEAVQFIEDVFEEPMKLEVWHSHWRAPLDTPKGESMHERFATFVTTDSNGLVSEVLVWPRDKRSFDAIGGFVVAANGDPRSLHAPEFIDILKARRGGTNGN